MEIRSITYFDNPRQPVESSVLQQAEKFITRAGPGFENDGYPVQTSRFATPPFPTFLSSLETASVVAYARKLESAVTSAGYDYLSLGPALPAYADSYPLIPAVIQETENVFLSGLMTAEKGVSLAAVQACGEIIHTLAPQQQDGFANLYFAALGNVPPGVPFFPAAYHDASPAGFALAIEGADVAMQAFQDAASLQDARSSLTRSLEKHSSLLASQAAQVEKETGASFIGIDYSLAPYPDHARSLGGALEQLGVTKLGQHGSVALAAFLADCIDRANFPRAGFSGLMLPVLEDAILAARAKEGTLTVKDLLLYATVCGTGLDTLPLPGDLSASQITAILLDVAALSLRLDKPLTARLMPIPNKSAGDPTSFDFPYFANSRIMDVDTGHLGNMLTGGTFLDVAPRMEDDHPG